MTFRSTSMTLVAGVLGAAVISHAAPWKFGIISDTQWQLDQDGQNPYSVAAGIVRQVDKAFVSQGVKFVVAVGDLADRTTAAGDTTTSALAVRATLAQELYNHRIGFYPLRGNHDDSKAAALEFVRVFPQTSNGMNNRTPANAFNYADSAILHTPVRASDADSFSVCGGFSSPNSHVAGLSYSFSCDDATFVLLDQFSSVDGTPNAIDSQLVWIDGVLSARPAGTHGFVFSHKGLITGDHTDVLFGSDPTKDSAGTNAFIRSLSARGVSFLINGHDHMHEYSRISTTDGASAHVHELTLASDSYKFYTPQTVPNDSANIKTFGVSRQVPVSQKLYDVGYYIVTVDGPNATIDYYGVPSGVTSGITTTPQLTGNWKWMERIGTSLVGKEFLVPQDSTYTRVVDSFSGTVAKILSGTNTAATTDHAGRKFSQLVNTGWAKGDAPLSSAVLSLWGLSPVYGTDSTAKYVLSLSYDSTKVANSAVVSGTFGLASRDASGSWQNAVALNHGGTPSFKLRAWSSSDELGTWGVDTASHTVWAVLNHASDFAATGSLPTSVRAVRAGSEKLQVVGRSVLVPSSFAGKRVEVQIRSQDGRLLSSFATTASSIQVPSSLHGVLLVRLRAEGARTVEGRFVAGR